MLLNLLIILVEKRDKSETGLNERYYQKSMTTLLKCFTFESSDNLTTKIICILVSHIPFQSLSIGIQID